MPLRPGLAFSHFATALTHHRSQGNWMLGIMIVAAIGFGYAVYEVFVDATGKVQVTGAGWWVPFLFTFGGRLLSSPALIRGDLTNRLRRERRSSSSPR